MTSLCSSLITFETALLNVLCLASIIATGVNAHEGPLRTLGASTGSTDHLILLYGRIADFAVRDVSRKREVEKYGPAPAIIEMMKRGPPPPGASTPGSSGASPHSGGAPGNFQSSSPPNFQYGGSSSAATSPMEPKHLGPPGPGGGQFPTMASNFMADTSNKGPFSPASGPPLLGQHQHPPQGGSPMTSSSSTSLHT